MSETHRPATLADLYRYEGKAELIAGTIVVYPHFGHLPGHLVGEITAHLYEYVEETDLPGKAFGPCLIYAVPPLPNGRESFCPDGSYYVGPLPANRMSWIEGPPTFAIEMRVQEDYEADTEPSRADKRADYFRAGTLVVWDVDPVAETIACYRAADPANPTVFRHGDVAAAEPAVPGWRLSVNERFQA